MRKEFTRAIVGFLSNIFGWIFLFVYWFYMDAKWSNGVLIILCLVVFLPLALFINSIIIEHIEGQYSPTSNELILDEDFEELKDISE